MKDVRSQKPKGHFYNYEVEKAFAKISILYHDHVESIFEKLKSISFNLELRISVPQKNAPSEPLGILLLCGLKNYFMGNFINV